MNLSTLTRTSSTMPLGYVMERFASCKETVMGLGSCIPSLLKIDKGIILMLAPRSQRALSKCNSLMVQGIVKLPWSLSFGGSFLRTMAEHSLLRAIVSKSANFLLLLKIPFKNFVYLGIWAIASTKGILILSCFNSSRNLANWGSTLFRYSAWGKGIFSL